MHSDSIATQDPLRTAISPLEIMARGFSCPQEGLDTNLLETIGGQLAQETTRAFLARHADDLNRRGNGVIASLERWLGDDEVAFTTSWHEAFGNAYVALGSNDRENAVRVGVDLALNIGAAGSPSEWSMTFLNPERLRWGRWLLPLSDRVSVCSDGVRACIEASLGTDTRTIEFNRVSDEWLPDSSDLIAMPEIGTRRPMTVLLSKPAIDDQDVADSLPDVATEIAPDVIELWRAAFAILNQRASVYESWVADVVRQIALLQSEPGLTHSGSYAYRYGFIHASARASPMSLAEVLVHEASHQYFYLLSRLQPVMDGTDTTLYFSPLVGKERPLDRILLAYHACGNILLFYRLCHESGASDNGYCARNEEVVLQQIAQLSAPLRGNPALSWTGRTLFTPLDERLA